MVKHTKKNRKKRPLDLRDRALDELRQFKVVISKASDIKVSMTIDVNATIFPILGLSHVRLMLFNASRGSKKLTIA